MSITGKTIALRVDVIFMVEWGARSATKIYTFATYILTGKPVFQGLLSLKDSMTGYADGPD